LVISSVCAHNEKCRKDPIIREAKTPNK